MGHEGSNLADQGDDAEYEDGHQAEGEEGETGTADGEHLAAADEEIGADAAADCHHLGMAGLDLPPSAWIAAKLMVLSLSVGVDCRERFGVEVFFRSGQVPH